MDKTSIGDRMKKYPTFSLEILDICNEGMGLYYFSDLEFYCYDKKREIDTIYLDFARFCNQTKHLKRRVNTVLILVAEQYGY